MLDLLHDLGSGRCPDERARIPVVLSKVLGNGAVQFGYTVKRPAPNAFSGDLGEPVLHQVQPRRTGGSEMQMVARMSGETGLHLGMRVRAVVGQDQLEVPR